MCDQTELRYVDGDIVWVKFHNFWWPGEVHGEDKLPPGLLKSFRRMPVAVVKFFQENAYEYVKTINDIYRYNCIRKHEFIKKGLELHRAKKRNMEKFPQDVRIAEEKTGGDPDIIESEEFQPEQKPNIANIFGDQTPKNKKVGLGLGLGRGRRKAGTSEDDLDLSYNRTMNISLKSAHATPTLSSPRSHASPAFQANRTFPSTSAPSPQSSTPNTNEFRCHLCAFSTTRLNVIVLHNKTHAADAVAKSIAESPRTSGKVKKTTATVVSSTITKPLPKPRGRKPKKKPVETPTPPPPPPPEMVNNAANDDDNRDTPAETNSDSDSERVPPMSTPRKTAKAMATRKRQMKKSPAKTVNVVIDNEKPSTSSAPDVIVTVTRKRGRKPKPKVVDKKPNDVVEVEILPTATEQSPEPTPPEEPTEIKTKLLADWDEDDDESLVSTSKEMANDLKDVMSSPNHSGEDDGQQKKAIRNIPKKDRRGNFLDEFYAKQVPSTHETIEKVELESNSKDETVLIESDNEFDDGDGNSDEKLKPSEISSTTAEEKSANDTNDMNETTIEYDDDDIIEVIPVDDREAEGLDMIEESEATEEITQQTPTEEERQNNEQNEHDVDLLKQSSELLEETSLLQKNIESVGIIQKKRRLLNRHKNDEDSESNDALRNSSIDESGTDTEQQQSKEKQPVHNDERRTRRRNPIAQTVTKTYRSSSRRKTKSTSFDEKSQLQSIECTPVDDAIKDNGLDENLPCIKDEEDVEMKPIKSEPIKANDCKVEDAKDSDEKTTTADTKPEIKMETDEISPTKSDTDSNKAAGDVDCFDFKEEEEEMPQTLNRRKRRCLPPGKVFELEAIDKLEELRKQEEDEQAKRIKLESMDDKDSATTIATAVTNHLNDTTVEVSPIKTDLPEVIEVIPEKPMAVEKSTTVVANTVTVQEKSPPKDDDVKDSKALPPKERGKRIFKSRNRSRLSEGDSFSNDEKSPIKEREANQSFDSIEKSLADSTMESPKTNKIAQLNAKTDNDEVPSNESAMEVNSTEVPVEGEEEEDEAHTQESQIESEVANTLITLTNSPVKMTESIVTSTEKDTLTVPESQQPVEKDEMDGIIETETTSSKSVAEQEHAIDVPPATAEKVTEPATDAKPTNKESAVENAPPMVVVKQKRGNDATKRLNSTSSNSSNDASTSVIQPVKSAKSAVNVVIDAPSKSNPSPKRAKTESSNPTKDAGDGVLIKSSNSMIIVPKSIISEVNAVSSTSTTPQKPQPQAQLIQKQPQQQQNAQQQVKVQQTQQQQQSPTPAPAPQKPKGRSLGKKVAVTIGHDLQGNPIVTYRKPYDKVIQLPSHIQTPELMQTVNPALIHTKPNPSTQFVITSKGALLKTTTNTITNQTTATTSMRQNVSQPAANRSQPVKSSQPKQKQMAAQQQQQQHRSSPLPMHAIQSIHVPTQQSINPHLIHKQSSAIHKANQQQMQRQQFIQQQMKSGGQRQMGQQQVRQQQKVTSNIIQHTQHPVQAQAQAKVNVNLRATNKKQQELLLRKQQLQLQQQQQQQQQLQQQLQLQQQQQQQQESVITSHAAEPEDNQLLAVPAENFDGPVGAFYLCKITENNDYIPIDNQPLYLDEKNQLIPSNLLNTVIQEELIEESAQSSQQQSAQQFEYQQEQIVDDQSTKYLLNVDGQQILLDQQSLLQLTSGGEMQQLVTADGQRLILQGSTQDILAAIQSSQQEQQIIIPSDMIEEDGNQDILAAALEDTGVFPQEQYIGDVLQGNGIETVDPLAFQTINQAPTSETNAILSTPIMSALEQPSKSDPVASPNVTNLDESLAVIGVSPPSTNVLPITVTNPAIAPKTTNAITTIYPSNVPTAQALQASQLSPISSNILNAASLSSAGNSLAKHSAVHNAHGHVVVAAATVAAGDDDVDMDTTDAVYIQEDETCEIVPNTPESVINHGFTSDNSNSSEIPLQSNLILRPPSIASMERDECDNGDAIERRRQELRRRRKQLQRQQRLLQRSENERAAALSNNNNNHHDGTGDIGYHQNDFIENSQNDVDSLILHQENDAIDHSNHHHPDVAAAAASLLLTNNHSGLQTFTINTNQNSFNTTNNQFGNETADVDAATAAATDEEPQMYCIIEQIADKNCDYDTDDVPNVEHFNS